MRVRSLCAAVAVMSAGAASLFAPATAYGVMIYAPNGIARPFPFTGPDTLIRFDSADPDAFVTVGSMGVANIGFGGMDFDRDGNLWAYASFFKSTGGAASGLYRVNTTTGQATPHGTLSPQSLQDMAFNPVDNRMYGVNTQQNVSRLYTIDLNTGATSVAGVLSGLPAQHHLQGLAIDSAGNFFLHEVSQDKIYKGTGLALSEMYTIPQDTNFSQGMTIDWSRDDRGYHAAVGQGAFPNYFAQLNSFATDGSGYVLGPDFGPNKIYEGFGYPPAEPGDLAIMPVIPEPASAALVAVAAAVTTLRRRRRAR